ncbi:methyl-accepting chemotaxis protein [Rhodoferax saidenbachensis]|uniref:Methyl-accepting chemotaxis protein n=1 Tax=Rhodoferax saidenbachensis TaxID=1484693 RepID=A0ABU1ZKA3_9BURK|nr:methyl-accepting chemotaxis protein [Rhodoferax saidenbachensis]MDR7305982.1 methyl-accepting chemotaxis protein [Rhodoferax saidenbachensis]
MSTSFIRQPSLARKLTLGFVAILLLLLAVAATGVYSVGQIGNSLEHIVRVNNRQTELTNALMDSINRVTIHSRSVALFTELDPKQLQVEFKAAESAIARLSEAEAALSALLTADNASADERALMGRISEQTKKVLPEVADALKQANDGDTVAAVLTLMNRVRPAEEALRKDAASLIALQLAQTHEASTGSEALQRKMLVLLGGLVAVALVAGGLIAWRITVGVTHPVKLAMRMTERIAAGDLTTQVPEGANDEIGRLLQAVTAMQTNLRGVVESIREAAGSIHRSSQEVAAGNLDLSNRTEQTAANLQQTAHSMGQLTDTVQNSANAARQASQLAGTSAEVAQRGGTVVSEVVATMQEINTSSSKIADIISVIDGIAFQTNILALNAAVEAARAGEQGRGFAVVASEVRSLAGRSAEAAKEIKSLISTSVERVERGTQLVAAAGQTMSEIVGSVQRVTHTIGDISATVSEQSEGIATVNTAITALDQMTQQNSALVEQSAAAAESLKDQAEQLTRIVSAFETGTPSASGLRLLA